jgi:hypothetical protein
MRVTVATIINADMEARPMATTARSPVVRVGQDAALTLLGNSRKATPK